MLFYVTFAEQTALVSSFIIHSLQDEQGNDCTDIVPYGKIYFSKGDICKDLAAVLEVAPSEITLEEV